MQRQGQLILLNRIAKRALKKSKIKKINSTQWQIAKGGTKLNIAIQIQMSQTICSKFEKLNYTFNTHHFNHKELTKIR